MVTKSRIKFESSSVRSLLCNIFVQVQSNVISGTGLVAPSEMTTIADETVTLADSPYTNESKLVKIVLPFFEVTEECLLSS